MFVALAFLLCAVSPPTRPTSGAMRRAFEAGRSALVEVTGKGGIGPGVLVGAEGEVLTSLRLVGLEEAQVRVGKQIHRARVHFSDPTLGVALLTLADKGPFPVLAVYAGEVPSQGWVVGLEHGKNGRPEAHLGRIRKSPPAEHGRFFRTDLSLGPGSPLLDAKGRLLGLVVSRERAGGSQALAIAALQAELTHPAP